MNLKVLRTCWVGSLRCSAAKSFMLGSSFFSSALLLEVSITLIFTITEVLHLC